MINSAKRGFTLVELIVVLTILAILAVIFIPTYMAYMDSANKSAAVSECKLTVAATELLYTKEYTEGGVTAVDIESTANVDGQVVFFDYDTSAHTLKHLIYVNYGWKVTYCKYYTTCPDHDEEYTVEKWDGAVPTAVPQSSSSPGVETSPSPSASSDTPDSFYVDGYTVKTAGDLKTYLSENAETYSDGVNTHYNGALLPSKGTVFSYGGNSYYCIRDAQYIYPEEAFDMNSSAYPFNGNYATYDDYLEDFLSKTQYCIPVDTSGVLTISNLSAAQQMEPNQFDASDPDRAIIYAQAGDLVYDEATGKMYVYTPYGTSANGYRSVSWWAEVDFSANES